MGSSWFTHSPLNHSHFPSSSSTSSCSSYFSSPSYSSKSVFLYSIPRNGVPHRKNSTAMACIRRDDPNDSVFCKRRAILFVGISVLPFLQLKAKSLQDFVTEEPDLGTAEQKQIAEKSLQGDALPNSFPSILNGLGIFSSAVLGALYALTRKEKNATEAMLESMIDKLNEKEATIDSLENNFESKLLNEKEERNQQLKKANEEQQSLMKQFKLANSIAIGLGLELQNEKRLVEDLNLQIENLQAHLTKAGEGKKELEEKMKEKLNSIEVLQERATLLGLEIKDKEDTLHDLNSTLSAKVSALQKLNTTYEQNKRELAEANSEIGRLKQELLNIHKDVDAMVSDLNAQLSFLIVQKEDYICKYEAIQKEYDDLKTSSAEKSDADAKLLGERDYELDLLKEKINLASNEVNRSQVLVAALTQERDDLRKMLDVELDNIQNLKHELQITQENHVKSSNEVCDLEKQLQLSRTLCSDLESEVSVVKAEFSAAAESFDSKLDEAKRSAEVLASELKSGKEVLKDTEDGLRTTSLELAAAAENCDSLRKELIDVYKKAESAAHDLEEEKQVVTSLNKELQALEKQISNDKESRVSLEMDLEEATKSLDEMNRNALLLSRELDRSKSQISGLEDEKDVLYKSLAEQKQFAQEARENMEDAHNLIMRLGKERENFVTRAKKLEEELASAKGEILRLRSNVNSSRALVNDQHHQEAEARGNAAVSVKKNSRWRKGDPQQDNS